MAKLEHRNLIRLLVYEFIPNMSLDRFLFDPIKRERLTWEKRYDIIVGISRGLLYLHEGTHLPIIHRDLKASNVLLDEQMQPKVSDFGMATQFDFDKTQETTRRWIYMAPEYAMHGRFSVKTDVHSFGVLVLEIIMGQRNNGYGHGENTDHPSPAWTSWIEGTLLMNLVDPFLQSFSEKQVVRCIEIALLCVQENPMKRPTMASIVSMLSHESLPLPTPLPKDIPLSVNDVSVTALSAR
ncbi:PREDICTED: cysteine-rich receptor-like protein kinase 27 [Tarenaya hassleriana]|uniref:cysteine-rich receptor-like protein kinase 27 n=1 Tax=Tarenaya hassleriana TaxID=28532 RepID=UPI0008FCE92F|nr:PREDICTED: cysteine-rich receptor-like protein kinase 27 [Tarenaya hassleriana]